jgi:DNA replication protein DnaC
MRRLTRTVEVNMRDTDKPPDTQGIAETLATGFASRPNKPSDAEKSEYAAIRSSVAEKLLADIEPTDSAGREAIKALIRRQTVPMPRPAKPAKADNAYPFSQPSRCDTAEGAAAREASEQRQRNAERRNAVRVILGDLGQRYHPGNVSLENYLCYDRGQAAVLAQVKTLAERLPESIRAGQNVILYGPVGTGKDHLLACLLYKAASLGFACRWKNGRRLFAISRDNMDAGLSEESFVSDLSRPAVLGISDPLLAVGDLSAWNTELLYRIVDSRYGNLRPIWMTMNAASEADADERLSAPVFDRLRHDAYIFHCFWPSYRDGEHKPGLRLAQAS